MNPALIAAPGGAIESPEGWSLRSIGPDLLEYVSGRAACLVNVGFPSAQQVRPIYASESLSDLFPQLREHLQAALPRLRGQFVVV